MRRRVASGDVAAVQSLAAELTAPAVPSYLGLVSDGELSALVHYTKELPC